MPQIEVTMQEFAAIARALGQLLVRATGAYTPGPACHDWDPPTAGQCYVEWQDGRCAGCGRPEGRTLNVRDHCHRTGIVRGLLCSGCNVSEGNGRNHAFWQRYRARPPTVICGAAEVYGTGAYDSPEDWVFRALGPVPETEPEIAAYLAAATALTPPKVDRWKDNVTTGLLSRSGGGTR